MKPNDPNTPPSLPAETNSPIVQPSPPTQAEANENDYFVVKTPQKKPIDRRAVVFVATLTVVGVILLIVVLVFALISSATGLANDYRRLAGLQINKIDAPLRELEPSAILNNRNPDRPGKAIGLSRQSLPSLESVLFVGGWSERYTQTERLEKTIHTHYQQIEAYKNDLKKLIAFDNTLNTIVQGEPGLTATVKPTDSLTIRSASGSYENYAMTIKDQPASGQLTDVKKQLASVYQAKATIYSNWAVLLESGNTAGEAKAKEDLLAQSGIAATLVEDEDFAALFMPSYTKLVSDQKALKSQLAS